MMLGGALRSGGGPYRVIWILVLMWLGTIIGSMIIFVAFVIFMTSTLVWMAPFNAVLIQYWAPYFFSVGLFLAVTGVRHKNVLVAFTIEPLLLFMLTLTTVSFIAGLWSTYAATFGSPDAGSIDEYVKDNNGWVQIFFWVATIVVWVLHVLPIAVLLLVDMGILLFRKVRSSAPGPGGLIETALEHAPLISTLRRMPTLFSDLGNAVVRPVWMNVVNVIFFGLGFLFTLAFTIMYLVAAFEFQRPFDGYFTTFLCSYFHFAGAFAVVIAIRHERVVLSLATEMYAAFVCVVSLSLIVIAAAIGFNGVACLFTPTNAGDAFLCSHDRAIQWVFYVFVYVALAHALFAFITLAVDLAYFIMTFINVKTNPLDLLKKAVNPRAN